MPKNKLQDVRDHLIEAMEILMDTSEKITPEQLDRLKLTNDIGKTLVESAKAESLYIRSVSSIVKEGMNENSGTGFIPLQEK